MLSFNLLPVFKAKGISNPYTFMVKAGISPNAATKMLNAHTRVCRLDHIEIICKALNCEPNDLLLYTPDQDTPLPNTHSLTRLSQSNSGIFVQETISQMPFRQLKEMTQNFIAQSQPNPNQE